MSARAAWTGIVERGSGLRARRSYLRWGATDEEVLAAVPGDEIVARANLTATRAITIERPAADVWPWLAQLGQGRGGFYSYDRLENLAGCDMHSAEQVVPRWQSIAVGDTVRLHPEVGLDVAQVEPGRAVVLRGGIPLGPVPAPYDFSWSFSLRDGPDRSSRLLVRERYGYTTWWSALLVEPVELVSAVMSRKMLRGIRDRAEGARSTRPEGP